MLWILSMSNWENDINDISISSGINVPVLKSIAKELISHGLII